MAWMDAVVPPTRRKQDRWIGLVGRRNVVGGKLGEEFPILWIIGVAVFIDRRRAAEQLGGASHVDDGHLAQQCTEALRITGEHIGDEQAAVRCAGRGDAAGVRDAPSDEVGGQGREVVVGKPPAFPARGLVPGRAEFASAANMRDHAGAAALEPKQAEAPYARAVGAPAPIETVIYPGAYHAWTFPDAATARFYPDFVSTKKCPLILLGPKRPALLIDGEAKPFDPAAFDACIAAAPGYSMGFDVAVRAQSVADTVFFLQRNLRP